MGAVLIGLRTFFGQTQKGLVNERRGLQRVTLPLAFEVTARNAAQVVIEKIGVIRQILWNPLSDQRGFFWHWTLPFPTCEKIHPQCLLFFHRRSTLFIFAATSGQNRAIRRAANNLAKWPGALPGRAQTSFRQATRSGPSNNGA